MLKAGSSLYRGCPSFVSWLYHKSCDLSRPFLENFGGNGGACPPKSRVRAESNRLTAFPKSLTVPIPLVFVPLLYHNLGGLPSLIVFWDERRYLARNSSKEDGSSGRQLQPLQAQLWGNLFCTLIVSYFKGFVKGFFTFFFYDWDLPSVSAGLFLPPHTVPRPTWKRCSLSPLDIISIPQTAHKVNR